MTDYTAKFNEQLSRVEAQKNAILSPLTELQNSYISVMGSAEPIIQKRIDEINQQYKAKIDTLKERHQRFKELLARPDRKFQIDMRNETVNFFDDPVYKESNMTVRTGMQERTLNSDGYFGPVFPERQKIQLYLPTHSEIPIHTVRDVIAAGTNTDLVGRIKGAVSSIRKKVGGIFDIMDLTENELFKLEEGLTKYLESSSNEKIDSMMSFITEIYRAPWVWNTLGEKEQNAIKYSMKKDGDTAFAEECQTMTKPREQRLAQIILNHCKVLKNCAQLTNIMDKAIEPPYDFDNPRGTDAAAVLYVGRYLVDQVQPQREPLYARAVADDLVKLLKINRAVEESVTSEELENLQVQKLRRIATSLVLFHSEHKKLTYNQRLLAFDIISDFYFRLQSAPNETKAKIMDKVEAITSRKPELLSSK